MQNRKTIIIVFIAVFIDLMGFGILIPILPTFASRTLHITDVEIGALVAVFSFVQFIFNPLFGKLSDRIGRKPIMLISLFFTVISYIIFSISNSFLTLLLSRMLAGFGGSNIAVAQAIIADITPLEERSRGMGTIGAAFGLGFVFGPMIGGIMSDYGYQAVGLTAAGFSFMALIFAFIFLKESYKSLSKKGGKIASLRIYKKSEIKKIFSNANIAILLVLFFVLTFSVANIYGTFPLLGYKVFHFTDKQTGMLYGIMGIVGVLVQGFGIRIYSEKYYDKTLILFGSFCMMAGLTLIPFGGGFLGVGIAIAIMSIGSGVLQPVITSMISKYSSVNEQGAILGINQSLSALARVFGPIWGGFAFDYIGYQFPFLTGGAVMAVAFIMLLFIHRSNKFIQ